MHASLGLVVKVAFFFRRALSLERKVLPENYTTLIERDEVESTWRVARDLREGEAPAPYRTRSSATAPSDVPGAATRSKTPPLPSRDSDAPYPSKARAPRVAMPSSIPIKYTTLKPYNWPHGEGRMVVMDNEPVGAFMRLHAPEEYEGVTRDAFVQTVQQFRKVLGDAGAYRPSLP